MGNKVVSFSEMSPVMREVLENGGEVSFIPSGTSMLPYLRGRIDRAILIKPPGKLKKHDVPLYQRTDGKFVLHRVVRVCDDGSYVMCGDHQTFFEDGITDGQILAVLKGIKKDGKYIPCDSFSTRMYCKTLGFRRFLKKVKSKIKTMIGRV